MSIDYSKLPRLAELCVAISDTGERKKSHVAAEIEFSTMHQREALKLSIQSWTGVGTPGLDIKQFSICTDSLGVPHVYTIDEMIAALEQVQAAGFRDVEEVAA